MNPFPVSCFLPVYILHLYMHMERERKREREGEREIQCSHFTNKYILSIHLDTMLDAGYPGVHKGLVAWSLPDRTNASGRGATQDTGNGRL